MEAITVTFPGGRAVDASWGAHRVHTDQPIDAGGADSGPSPYDLFLASVATCAGYYVQGFCLARNIPLDGIRLVQRVESGPDATLPGAIRLELTLPPTFPEKYCTAVVRAAEGCKVKKAIAAAPLIYVTLVSPRAP